MPPLYPPYQQPLVERRTGVVTRPWQLFFLSLVAGTTEAVLGLLPPDSIPLDRLAYLDPSRLLGRGDSGRGPVETLLVGEGLALTGTTLSATATDIAGAGYWTPITNGDPLSPELLFDSAGDCIVGFVPTPEA